MNGAFDQELLLRLAQAIHDRYVAGAVAGGQRFGTSPLVAWADLSDDLRAANLAQARDIPRKLARVGCTAEPASGRRTGPRAFTDAELEALSIREHERWARQRRRAGWRYAPARDNARKLHPCLVSWNRLPESEREKDRDVVRRIPGLLADVGLRIVRPAG